MLDEAKKYTRFSQLPLPIYYKLFYQTFFQNSFSSDGGTTFEVETNTTGNRNCHRQGNKHYTVGEVISDRTITQLTEKGNFLFVNSPPIGIFLFFYRFIYFFVGIFIPTQKLQREK